MKYYFNGIVVVEGKDDVAFLSSFLDAIYVTTRGNVIPKEEMDFIINCNGVSIIVLTDSDAAGELIRERINKQLINAINIKLDIDKCNKNNKHGVAESTAEEVINKLNLYLKKEKPQSGNITLSDLVNLKCDKKILAKKLHLGLCNTKTLIKRINFKQINIETIKKVMEG